MQHILDRNTPATHDQNGKDEAANFAEGRRSWQWWTGFATASELMVWRLAEAGELQREAPRCVELLRRATHASLEEAGDADFRIQAGVPPPPPSFLPSCSLSLLSCSLPLLPSSLLSPFPISLSSACFLPLPYSPLHPLPSSLPFLMSLS